MVVTSNPSFWVTDEGKLQQTLHKVSVFFFKYKKSYNAVFLSWIQNCSRKTAKIFADPQPGCKVPNLTGTVTPRFFEKIIVLF